MRDFLMRLLGDRFFMPHGHCYLWEPAMLWIQVLTNAAIGLAYMAITVTLFYLVKRSRDIPFSWMYVAFGIFIVTCGLTHFSDVLVIWYPYYWLDGTLRAITALASVATAIMLPPLVPKAIALTDAARVAHERGIQLEDANKRLGELLDKTQELEQLKTEFFANVSHELRTPLALVLGPAEKLLARPDLAPEARRDLEVIGRNARTLLKHVNDLLDISKLEAGRMAPAYSRLDAVQLVRLAAGHFEAIAAEREVAFAVDADGPLEIEADADKVQRVVLNLLSNAFKFTPVGGRVRCAVAAEGGSVRIVVADSGPGIRPEDREAIFERFRQLEGGTTRRFGGTGLGLAIARDFVALHHGSIDVVEAPEGGAQFTVTLPRRAPAGTAVASTTSAADAEAARLASQQAIEELRTRTEAIEAATGGGRPVVLVAEDNDEMRRFVADTLRERYDVIAVPDGRQALARALASAPDLVLTDVMMPEMAGDELVRALRAERSLDGVPIMLLTAKADDELRIRLLQEGAQDYLMKPFAVEELRARAANLVTTKRVRDVLQRELDNQLGDLEQLAGEVTQRKRELETTLQQMRVARAQAETASRAKTSFLGLVSHELRTPLSALELQLERLRLDGAGELTDGQRAIVERMTRTTARLTDLIESLLTHARMQADRLEAEVSRFALASVAREVVGELTPAAAAKQLTLELVEDPSLPEITSDPRLVRLVLVNLLDNAIKYTSTGGITVEVSHRDGTHALTVRDTGPGIRREDRVRIFQPFEQLEPMSAKRTPGVGLGLSLVRDMVAALGGSIELDSVTGQGSSFVVRLPNLPSA